MRNKLHDKMVDTYRKIHSLSKMKKCSMRKACYMYSLTRLEQVYLRRGLGEKDSAADGKSPTSRSPARVA